MNRSAPLPATTSRRGLLVGLALGLPIVAFGLRGVFVDAARTHPGELTRWVVGAAVASDLLVVPSVAAVAWAVRRFTPPTWWPIVRGAAMATGALLLVAWPFVRGYGSDPANPSLLPRDYGTGLAAAVGAVWGIAALVLAARWARRRVRTHRDRRHTRSIVGAGRDRH